MTQICIIADRNWVLLRMGNEYLESLKTVGIHKFRPEIGSLKRAKLIFKKRRRLKINMV